ncbi:peptidoglycan-binding protein [Streptomyces sp. Ru72]|uniref:peptidoglycan-binding protein n=1 Tax=Streptomyces sp. Ru72 TaxID=2080747 RepID=UPI0011B0BD74|nr:peptidoglycan-binding protein [Streptomyces sp. Ru72]
METPVFEEFEPTTDCDCPGCVRRRRVITPSSALGGIRRPRARTALALAAAAGTALGMVQATPTAAATHVPLVPPAPPAPSAPASDQPPDTPQGKTAPLHGPVGAPNLTAAATTTRAEIINRAKKWVDARVPYSMDDYWSDGYRQDCSGFVSMAWNLGSNEWTGSLDNFGVRITKEQLQPGDILLFHNPDNPEKGSHVVIFGGWSDYKRTAYIAYEETPPGARRKVTPYAYWSNSSRYVPYRYKNITETKESTQGKEAPVPGLTVPGLPGVSGVPEVPGVPGVPDVPGLPGPDDSTHPVPGTGGTRPVVTTPGRSLDGVAPGAPQLRSAPAPEAPDYPGRDVFRPGADNPHVALLGRKLVEKGFGAHYTGGPDARWGEADRRNVEAFQRAQGWNGREADGFPGPETWRRLFS